MWGSAFNHFGDILAEPAALVPAAPAHQPHFNASSCIQLLGVLQASEAEADLRESALARLRAFMAEDAGAAAAPPTVPRVISSRRRRSRSSSSSSASSASASSSSSASSSHSSGSESS